MSNEIERIREQGLVSSKLMSDVGKFQVRLNSDPDINDIEINPIVGSKDKPVKFIPIGAIEALLDKTFNGLYSITIADTKIVANEIVIVAKIRYFHPIAQTWLERDGIGAAQIRWEKDVPITELKGKKKTALQADAPHAYAEAIKNAAKKIGNIFGRNINREDDYERYETFDDFLNIMVEEDVEQIKLELEKCESKQDLVNLYKKYSDYTGLIEFKRMFLNRRKELGV